MQQSLLVEDDRDKRGHRDVIQCLQCGVQAPTGRRRSFQPREPPTSSWVASRWREVSHGSGLDGASSAMWDVQTVGGGVWVSNGRGDIAQGDILLAQRSIGCKKGSQLMLMRVMLLLQPSFQLH